MEKSNIPKEISIPLSVIFRYIPSVYEEIKSITNAMKMRGFGLNVKSLKNPLQPNTGAPYLSLIKKIISQQTKTKPKFMRRESRG